MPSRSPDRLRGISPDLLEVPTATLGLSSRAARCLEPLTIAALLSRTEREVARGRQFGPACLAEVRRSLTVFALRMLEVGEQDPMWTALLEEHPALVAAWSAPPQPHPFRQVVEEILELLARAEGMERRRSRPARNGSPAPVGLGTRGTTLGEVTAVVYGPLKSRERELLEARFAAPLEAAPSLAELGRRFRLSRERVRQIVAQSLLRIGEVGECRRRAAVTEQMHRLFETAGGVLSEEQAIAGFRRLYPGPRSTGEPLARVLLEATPAFQRVCAAVWCAGEAPDRIRELLASLHVALRDEGRTLTPRQALAVLRKRGLAAKDPEPRIAACLAADGRFRAGTGNSYGLREWDRGIPQTLVEAAEACLRWHGKPLSGARLTALVNGILPTGAVVRYPEIRDLLAGSPRFQRTEGGLYFVAELPASGPPRRRAGAGPANDRR